MLSDKEKRKLVRQVLIELIGIEGQNKLKGSKILVIGAGGLGSGVLYYLTSSGVGTIGIVDSDRVDWSNLNRQILHFENDVGNLKVESAQTKLIQLNTDVQINTYPVILSQNNAKEIISEYDFVIEASDNFETKFLVNDICVSLNIPFVIGGVFQFEGQLMTVIPNFSACYRCVFKDIPEPGTYPNTCDSGIMGTTAGFFGLIQANEAIKYVLFSDVERSLANKLLVADIQYNSFEIVSIQKDEHCTVCSSQ